ncbi:hypothetical protein JOC37_000658 [Desulfohalotomaculum tongense]|uniref:DNRLRE domain-containing protein n=1 Tax=Desulforadius tongensis TaxID=1216062 RepID=UPI00195F1162|nr:DNRLRE domain-containing protein [Desulforadius tongensis]MBM7854285.1 hypothetical protein [Desulforadius tongensis]
MKKFIIKAQKDTFVASAAPRLALCRAPKLVVGTGRYCKLISYIYFDLSPLPREMKVVSARLKLHFDEPPFISTPLKSLLIKMLAEPFNDCETAYNNKPELIPGVGQGVKISSYRHPVTADVTKIVKYWHTEKIKNNGLALLPGHCTMGAAVFCSADGIDSSLHPVLTVKVGKAHCSACQTNNIVQEYTVSRDEKFSAVHEVWCYSAFSLVIKNVGTEKVLIKLQNSPDGSVFIDEEPEYELSPDQAGIFVNRYFTRFSRVKFYLAAGETGMGKIKIWLQGRKV